MHFPLCNKISVGGDFFSEDVFFKWNGNFRPRDVKAVKENAPRLKITTSKLSAALK